jgi:hypothetical protein
MNCSTRSKRARHAGSDELTLCAQRRGDAQRRLALRCGRDRFNDLLTAVQRPLRQAPQGRRRRRRRRGGIRQTPVQIGGIHTQPFGKHTPRCLRHILRRNGAQQIHKCCGRELHARFRRVGDTVPGIR